MPDNEYIQIKLSKVIKSNKLRIIRLLTKVDEFPTFMPNVKESKIIHKDRNTMKTKWRVQIGKVPISWVEEDRFAFSEGAIFFNAVEGDLEMFKGKWSFQSLLEGTEVCVEVTLKVGIPAIGEFADSYLKDTLTKNFQSILDSLEKRLISIKYSDHKKDGNGNVAGFGIIGHLYNFNHLERCLKTLKPDFKMPSRDFIGNLFQLTPSFKLYDILDFESSLGNKTSGCFIVATFIPEMIERDMWTIFSKVVRACKIAEKNGVGIVTLGGFTSIVGERIGEEIAKHVDVPVTTGNTFTAAMTIEGVLKAAELMGLDINSSKITIVGGTGDIGSACARAFSYRVKQLTITGRTKSNLKKLQNELAKIKKAKIIATMDNEKAVREADIVIAAASAVESIINVDWFKPGAIICDVGYPKNVSYAPVTREDILIFSGGLTKHRSMLKLPIDIGLPDKNTIYGCFAEAMILAFEKRFESFSTGRGNITLEKIDEIRRLGNKHGFEVADFYWGSRKIDELTVEKLKGTANV